MPKRILLADDSLTIQKVVELTLATEDYSVAVFGSGEAALQGLKDRVPDLILADVDMPGRTGYEVCEIVKSDSKLAHIPVLLLVGRHEPFDEERATRVGADGFIVKPFEGNTLIQRVRDLLSPPPVAMVPEEALNSGADPFGDAAGVTPAAESAWPAAEPVESAWEEPPATASPAWAAPAEPFGGEPDPFAAASADDAPAMEYGASPMAYEPAPFEPASFEPSPLEAAPFEPAPFEPESIPEREYAEATPAAWASQPAMDTPMVESVMQATTADDGGGDTEGLIPEEVIDLIAERVIQKLSDAVVRDVVWQVVPELAELMIKRKLEELG